MSAWSLAANPRDPWRPPGLGDDYRCRICWKLVYLSSQEAYRWDRGRVAPWLAAWFAARGITMREVEKVMSADFKAQREADRAIQKRQ